MTQRGRPRLRLVLVHGTLVSSAQWVNYPALLADPSIEVVTPDLPGHGSLSATRFSWPGALAAIDAAVRGTAPDDDPNLPHHVGGPAAQDVPVVLAGHSLGGYLSLAWASEHGDRLAGLALIGAAGDPSTRAAGIYRGAARLFDRIGIDRLDRLVNRNLHRIVPPDTINAVRAAGVSYASVPDSWPAVMANVRPQLLDTVDCPVLFLGGQFDQLRVHTKRFAAHTRNSQITVVPRATHLGPITHQTATARALKEFLDRVVPA